MHGAQRNAQARESEGLMLMRAAQRHWTRARRSRHWRYAIPVCLLVLLLPLAGTVGLPTVFAAPSATIVDLGTLGGPTSAATAINASGEVAGYATTVDGATHAFLYDGKVLHDLGTLGGADSMATALNSRGEVAGTFGSYGKPFGPAHQSAKPHAFFYDGQAMHDLGTLGGPTSNAVGVNADGQVAGFSTVDANSKALHAFLYDGKTLHDLGVLAGNFSAAAGISRTGEVAGTTLVAGGVEHAFRDDGKGMRDLGTLPGGRSSIAAAISSTGRVVGMAASAYGPNHAFISDGSGLRDLGTLGGAISAATAINASNQVVGYSYLRTAAVTHAVFWSASGGMLDLNRMLPANSGWELTYAAGINDRGQIVGTGLHNGTVRAFLLTPAAGAVAG